MKNNSIITCSFPFCNKPDMQETDLSIAIRITTFVLGTVAIIGVLTMDTAPEFGRLGQTWGWTSLSVGTAMSLGSLFIKSVKKINIIKSHAHPIIESPSKKEAIQKRWHLFVGKARRILLSQELFKTAKPYIDDKEKLIEAQRPSTGHTSVYLPNDTPIVLKFTTAYVKRFNSMLEAHSLCEKNGYNDLIIPQARMAENCIIERRLPLKGIDEKEQIGLYIENQKLFTNAVKEFVGLLCQSYFMDILRVNPYDSSFPYIASFDNIPLYLGKGRGKIGLIDLEFFSKLYKGSLVDYKNECLRAIKIFPYHFEEILSVVKQFFPKIELFRTELESERNMSLKGFHLIYENHARFIKDRGITTHDPLRLFALSSERIEKIKQILIEKMINEPPYQKYNEILKEVIIHFDKNCSHLLNLVVEFIQDLLKEKSKSKRISSPVELVTFRSLYFGTTDAKYIKLRDSLALKLDMFKYVDTWKKIIGLICRDILKELANGGEIAHFGTYYNTVTACLFV